MPRSTHLTLTQEKICDCCFNRVEYAVARPKPCSTAAPGPSRQASIEPPRPSAPPVAAPARASAAARAAPTQSASMVSGAPRAGAVSAPARSAAASSVGAPTRAASTPLTGSARAQPSHEEQRRALLGSSHAESSGGSCYAASDRGPSTHAHRSPSFLLSARPARARTCTHIHTRARMHAHTRARAHRAFLALSVVRAPTYLCHSLVAVAVRATLALHTASLMCRCSECGAPSERGTRQARRKNR